MVLHIRFVVLGSWGQCPHHTVHAGQDEHKRKCNQCHRTAFQTNMGILEEALFSLSFALMLYKQAMSVIKCLFLSQAVTLSFSLCCPSLGFFMIQASLFK